jgi:hypothetical protein
MNTAQATTSLLFGKTVNNYETTLF